MRTGTGTGVSVLAPSSTESGPFHMPLLPSPVRPSRMPGLALVTAVVGFGLAPACTEAQDPAVISPMEPAELRGIWDQGVTFPEFLEAAEARRERWNRSYEEGTVSRLNRDRADRIASQIRILAVAADWCGDSAANLPYLARMVEGMEGVEFRIVNPDQGREIMDRHPNPDGRGATPTLLFLDEGFQEVGCWIERPAPLQAWYQANKGSLNQDDLYARLWSFYDTDRGETALSEILRVMESAQAGSVVCGLP